MTQPEAEQSSEIFTLDEVSEYLKAGKRTIYRLAQHGTIPAFKLGGTWRFRRSELDRWIADGIVAAQNKNFGPK
jgi:excisionase family DNA binding protein